MLFSFEALSLVYESILYKIITINNISQNNAKTTFKIMFQKLITRSKKYIIFQSCKITSKKVQSALKNKRY